MTILAYERVDASRSRTPKVGVPDGYLWHGQFRFFASGAVPIVQQIAVAIVWRAQLCHQVITRWFGGASSNAMYGVVLYGRSQGEAGT